MVGLIHKQHGRLLASTQGGANYLPGKRAWVGFPGVGRKLLIMQQCLNILVPGNYEAAELTIFMHRSMLTQICQYGVGVFPEFLINRGELYTLWELT